MIGKNIAKLRKQKGLTLTELAERAGVAKSYLSNIEREVHQNPSIQVIEKIIFVLGVEIEEVIRGVYITEQNRQWQILIKEMRELGIEKDQMETVKQRIYEVKNK
ncbi:helix-turn-helix transcriptional regulator [Cytobacillus sp. FSL W7-1323]|uniref:HTH cro/C1-type domain-containing protein n=1 Tax=Cytobacillus kochii TaxID=859143 RepID=A0A248TJZ5_9BACI|nr:MULTISPECIES: helix-turn-helix transcriptional regulator [Cytobacillus]ASV68536.1 hypothetical protein CKF48_15215 [Cytobacillus kochii]MCA1027718.1 helix-turn-helix domain-containing protein [Cytobacillus kochii]MCM3324529.1 helix-turn-helix domain-containing protein [Cytobacillus kochii]MCM3346922.1 helix-turn-helix domain-containing protein [Cytobacillus kochii]MDM5208986.1 helix-turn-helix transcriptional regulator [Cytobacillus kochii]